jgi:transcriptional regulator with XRE-family HTH domain
MFDGFLAPLVAHARGQMNNAIANLPRHTFGTLMKTEREKQGLSHREIAVRVGVDREVIKQWEKDEQVPDRQQLKRLFGSMQRLRHFVHLLPREVQNQAAFDMTLNGQEMPAQYAAIVEEAPAAPKTFAEALRRERLSEGLDQEEMGELFGVTSQAVSAWEREVAVPVQAHYEALCELFPMLGRAPKPEVRNIPKPDGGRGQEKPRTTETTEEEPMNRPPVSVRQPAPPPQSTPQPVDIKGALIRWGRLVHGLKSHEDITMFTDFLAEANDAGMTLQEVMAALADPS